MDVFKTIPVARGELARVMFKPRASLTPIARLERAQLLTLTDRELPDIGMSRIGALREAGKSLWKIQQPSRRPESRKGLC